MPSENQTTTNPAASSGFDFGESNVEIKGFQQNQLPPADGLWPDYYKNVMRGSEDNFSDPTSFQVSRTFSENSPTDVNQFVPNLSSPGEVPGTVNVEPSSKPLTSKQLQVMADQSSGGTNGSVADPEETSPSQTTQGNGTGNRSIYQLGNFSQ